jgi:PAS domain S-box-containing protein
MKNDNQINGEDIEINKRFKSIFQSMPSPTFIWQKIEADFQLVDFNKAAKLFAGDNLDSLLDAKASVLYADSLEIIKDFNSCIDTKTSFRREMEYQLRSNGEIKYVNAHYSYIDIDLVLLQVEEITDVRKREKLNKKEADKLSNILQNLPFGLSINSNDYNSLFLNDTFIEMLGYTAEEIRNREKWLESVYPDKTYRESIQQKWLSNVQKSIIENSKCEPLQSEVRCKDGSVKIIESCYASIGGEYITVLIDVTKKLKDEEELIAAKEKIEENEFRLTLAAKAANLGIWDWNILESTFHWDEKMHELYGLSQEDDKDKFELWTESLHPEDKDRIIQELQDSLTSDGNYSSIFRIIRKSGELVYIKGDGLILKDKEGVPYRMIGVNRDITEKTLAENKLKEYKFFFENSNDFLNISNTNGYCEIVNQQMLKTLGYSEEELLQRDYYSLIHPDDLAATTAEVDHLRNGEITSDLQIRHRKKDGDYVWVEWNVSPKVVNGKIYSIGRDITQSKIYEEQLNKASIKAQENERYEIGGELHDNVCQILTVSQLYLQQLESSLEDNAKVYYIEALQNINLALKEVRSLSHRLAPAFFDSATLKDSFMNLLKDFNAENRFIINMNFNVNTIREILSADLQLNLFRILQEQLKNILKHADAKNIDLLLKFENDKLTMIIKDDGVGFNPTSRVDGIGITNMRRRVQMFSGKVIINSSVGKGCELVVEIPII